MKQCFTWWSFARRGTDVDSLLRGAKEIGFGGVELMPSDVFERAIDNGLEIVTHGGHDGITDGLNNPANHGRIQQEIESNLELAARYRIQKLIVFSGNRRPDLNDKEGQDHTIAGLMRLAPLAESAGVPLILELLNSKIDHPEYQCDSSVWACEVVRAVNSPFVKVLFDIYHAQIMEGDLIRTIQKNETCFGHYHTAGNPGRKDLDDNQEISYPAVFRAIAATGYAGFIGHEFMPKADPLAALREAYQLLESAIK